GQDAIMVRNSPTNPLKPGTASEDRQMKRKRAANHGITALRPPYSAISKVCRRSYSIPTIRNSAPVEMPWLSIWYTAPTTEVVVKAATPSITKPRWLTDEYATSFFRFGCTSEP